MFIEGKFCSVNLKNSFLLLFRKSISNKSPAPKFTTDITLPTFSFLLSITSKPSKS